jgi:hypothetical protein
MNGLNSPSKFALWKSPLAIGPILFTTAFAVRSVTPALDSLVVSITVALAVVVGFMFAGQRWAGAAFLIFPVALFASPAGREFSFNLSSIDNRTWRVHAIVGLLGLGVSSVAAVFVMVGNKPRGRSLAAGLFAGAALGALMTAALATIYKHPAFGQDLTAQEIAALPVIEMLNYGYDIPDVQVRPNNGLVVRVNNSSDLPHTVTIDSLGINLYIPAGRFSVLQLTDDQVEFQDDRIPIYCTVGDHQTLGMKRTLDFVRIRTSN